MDTHSMPNLLELAAALGWTCGVRMYMVVMLIGATGYYGWAAMPTNLYVFASPPFIVCFGVMAGIEFFIDKVQGLDSFWGIIHTMSRIPSGAVLATLVFGTDHQELAVVALVLGGALAAFAHLTKACIRAAINTSPEPFSNIGVSLFEDGAVCACLWLALNHPKVLTVTLVLSIIVSMVLVRHCWRFFSFSMHRAVQVFAGRDPIAATHGARAPGVLFSVSPPPHP
jgi:hypothetical protein